MPGPTALIAEDEPLLAQALRAELARAWGELDIVAVVGDGLAAVEQALALKPQILFLDIQMPGQTGLDAAAEIAERWVGEDLPALVFVTAFDHYAVQAFEAQALDYVLKPVQAPRLAQTVARLRQRLLTPAGEAVQLASLAQLRALMAMAIAGGGTGAGFAAQPSQSAAPLSVLTVGIGDTVRLVALDQVLYFEAADKYVRVLTAEAEHLIRTPLKELLPRLDAQVFWQIHRGCVVRLSAIDAVLRDPSGRISLSLRQRPERLGVSRLYAPQFKAM